MGSFQPTGRRASVRVDARRRFRYGAAYGWVMAAAGKKLRGHGARSKARSPAASVGDGGYSPPPHPMRLLAGQRFWPRRATCRRPFVVARAPCDDVVVGVRIDGGRERVRTTAHRLLATRPDGQGLHYSFLGWESRRYRTWAVVMAIEQSAATVVLPEWHPGRPVRLPSSLLPVRAGVGRWLTLRADLSVSAGGQPNPSGFACCEDPGVARCRRPTWRCVE